MNYVGPYVSSKCSQLKLFALFNNSEVHPFAVTLRGEGKQVGLWRPALAEPPCSCGLPGPLASCPSVVRGGGQPAVARVSRQSVQQSAGGERGEETAWEKGGCLSGSLASRGTRAAPSSSWFWGHSVQAPLSLV